MPLEISAIQLDRRMRGKSGTSPQKKYESETDAIIQN